MTIRFTKMHGLGNDFMIIDAIRQRVSLTSAEIATLSQRHTGVGFDQCLLVEKSTTPSVDFFYRIYNADGHEVGQCGNGARCLARFLQHYQLTDKSLITVATTTTQLQLQLNHDDTVTVNMGTPKEAPTDIPLLAPEQRSLYSIPLPNGNIVLCHALQIGNPHAVLMVSDLDDTVVSTLGKLISEHEMFPEQVNVGFMKRIHASRVQLRVYERGSGETQACGSGAVAAAAMGMLYHHLHDNVTVSLPGGELNVHWPQKRGPIFLTGPATFVYEGQLF